MCFCPKIELVKNIASCSSPLFAFGICLYEKQVETRVGRFVLLAKRIGYV